MGELNYTMKRKKREHSSAAPKQHRGQRVWVREGEKKWEEKKKRQKQERYTRQQRDMKLVFAAFSIGWGVCAKFPSEKIRASNKKLQRWNVADTVGLSWVKM